MIWMVCVWGGGWGVGRSFFSVTLISGIENSQGKTSRTLGTGRKPQLPGTEQSLAVVLCSTLQEKGRGRDRGECLEAVVGGGVFLELGNMGEQEKREDT